MKKILIFALILTSLTACGNTQNKEKEHNKTVKTEKIMKPVHLTKAEFLTKVVNYETTPNEWKYLGDKPAIVDFYADWCGPCKMVAPVLEELQAEYGDSIVVYKVNTDEEQELAAVFGIRSIPSLLFIPMNEKPQMTQGAMGKGDLKKAIDTVLLHKK